MKAGLVTTTHLRTFCTLCGSPPSGPNTKGAGLQNLALPTPQHQGLAGSTVPYHSTQVSLVQDQVELGSGRRKGCALEPWMDWKRVPELQEPGWVQRGWTKLLCRAPVFRWVHGQSLCRACHAMTTITRHACNNMPCLQCQAMPSYAMPAITCLAIPCPQ